MKYFTKQEIMARLIATCSVCVLSVTPSAVPCNDGTKSAHVTRNKRLLGNFHAITGIGPRMCEELCLAKTECLSFNYDPQHFKCELNGAVSGGESDSDFTNETDFIYVEKAGRKAAGPCSTITCGDHEQCIATSSSTTSCIITECDPLQNIENNEKELITKRWVGRVFAYKCRHGYTGVGTMATQCLPNGTWSAVGQCIRDCGNPPSLSNGAVSYTSTLIDSVATYSCNSNYVIQGSGSKNIVCTLDGWINLEKYCSYDCGNPPSISDGTVSYTSTLENTLATYNCDSSYVMQGTGNGKVVCTSSGWSTVQNECRFDCGNPPSLADGTVSYTSTLENAVATYSCDSSYVMQGTGNGKVVCKKTGWSSEQNECVFDCGAPPAVSRGTWTYTSTLVSSQATLSCQSSYQMRGSGDASIECRTTGWTSTNKWCGSDCGEPNFNVPNSVLNSGQTSEGSQRSYTCNSGYKVSGSNSVITCQSTGAWSTPLFTCVDKCPSSWTKRPTYGVCYQVINVYQSWDKGRDACAALDATLVSLQTVAKRNNFFAYLSNTKGYHHEKVYIGASANHGENGQWTWETDNSQLTSASGIWKDGEPNESGPACAYVHHEKEVKDEECGKDYLAACEIVL